MDAAESGPLTSPPAEFAALVGAFASDPWPSAEANRRRLFERLGLRDGTAVGDDSTPLVIHSIDGVLDGRASAFWSTVEGRFLGIALFAYASPRPDSARTKRAYDALHPLLTATYGAPVREWGPAGTPAAQWRANGLLIDLYCLRRRDSVIQLGVEHAELSATAGRSTT